MTAGTDALRCEADRMTQAACGKQEVAGRGSRSLFILLRLGWQRFARMRQVATERRALAALDEMQLRDLGISADAQRRELRRPFWDF